MQCHWIHDFELIPGIVLHVLFYLIIPHTQRSCWGGILVSLHPSVCPSRIPCLLCSAYSSGWIHFIFINLIKQLQEVCCMKWFLQNFKIWIFGSFFKFVTLTLSCFDLGSDVNHQYSMGNHVVMGGISERRRSSCSSLFSSTSLHDLSLSHALTLTLTLSPYHVTPQYL